MKAHIYQYTVAWCGHFLSVKLHLISREQCAIFSLKSTGCLLSPTDALDRNGSFQTTYLCIWKMKTICVLVILSNLMQFQSVNHEFIIQYMYLWCTFLYYMFFDSNQLMNNSIIYLMFQLNSYTFLEQLHVFLKLV